MTIKTSQYLNIVSTAVLIFICSLSQAQPKDRPPNEITGHCYAKALMADIVRTEEMSIPVYFGEDSTIIENYTSYKKIVLQEERSVWKKRAADRNCLSSDPLDCLVWCLVTIDEEIFETDRYLTDLTVTDEYDLEYYETEYVVEKRGYTEWQEIVCANEITLPLMDSIRTVLNMEIKDFDITLDRETKINLVKYQKANNLPIGQLDLTTIKHMGIDWW